jgi:6,7-dimethyl-8-ribityllumazine synthase
MSGAGSPTISTDASGLRVTIVSGQWHTVIADGLLAGAERALAASGADYTIVRVPGSFELPVVAKAALNAGADAVVALGVIIRGGTPHFEFVSDAATTGLTQVAIETGKPVGFGVLTLDTEEQGIERAGLEGSHEDKGAEAADAAVATALILRQLSSPAATLIRS